MGIYERSDNVTASVHLDEDGVHAAVQQFTTADYKSVTKPEQLERTEPVAALGLPCLVVDQDTGSKAKSDSRAVADNPPAVGIPVLKEFLARNLKRLDKNGDGFVTLKEIDFALSDHEYTGT